MKKRFKTIGGVVALSAMMIVAASCAKEDLSENAQNQITGVKRYISVSANLPTMGGEDKAYMDPTDDNNVKWEIGDEININGTVLSVTGTANSNTTAFFDGTVYAFDDHGNKDLYWAVYPKDLLPITNSSTISTVYDGMPDLWGYGREMYEVYCKIPTTQTFDASQNPLKGCTYMAGFASVEPGASTMRFEMKNMGSVLRINLKSQAGESNTKVSKLVFTSDKQIAGHYRFDHGGWGLAPQGGSATDENTLVVNLTDGTHDYIDIAGGATVYVLLCTPANEQINLTMTVYNSEDAYCQKISKNIKLMCNSIYTSEIKDISFDKTSNPFSVSAYKKVFFSPGNLQYLASSDSWAFAKHQWDAVGDAAGNTAPSASLSAWIDLFGWGTSGYHYASDPYNVNYYPYSTSSSTVDVTYNRYGYGPSTNMTDPDLVGTSANYDWGVYNAIYNPITSSTDPARTWRTLTKDEWVYLIITREVNVGGTPEKMYGHASVNGVNGLVILPDNWNPASCSGFTYGNSAWTNTFTEATTPKWSQMEALGCVFLPVTGVRTTGTNVMATDHGFYWTSTHNTSASSYHIDIQSGSVITSSSTNRYTGRAVRLVKDAY